CGARRGADGHLVRRQRASIRRARTRPSGVPARFDTDALGALPEFARTGAEGEGVHGLAGQAVWRATVLGSRPGGDPRKRPMTPGEWPRITLSPDAAPAPPAPCASRNPYTRRRTDARPPASVPAPGSTAPPGNGGRG